MKRPSEDDGNQPIKRNYTQKVVDLFWGIPFNDELATDEAYKKEILEVLEDEINTSRKYQRAMSNLEKAILEKEEAETHITLVERKKKTIEQKIKGFYQTRDQFIKDIVSTHKEDLDNLPSADKPVKRGKPNETGVLKNMMVNDLIYSIVTGEHLPKMKETLQKYNISTKDIQNEASSSVQPPQPNEASSSSSQPAPQPAPQAELQPAPQPELQPAQQPVQNESEPPHMNLKGVYQWAPEQDLKKEKEDVKKDKQIYKIRIKI